MTGMILITWVSGKRPVVLISCYDYKVLLQSNAELKETINDLVYLAGK